MAAGFHSQSWYRAAHLRPMLARRTEVSRQVFRGALWYVLRDPVTGKFTRISETAHWIVAQMDGQRSLGEIWDIACAELGDTAPSQDDLLSLAAQLSGLDLLHTDGLPDTGQMASRGRRLHRRGLIGRFLNPLALRFPIFDPDRLISALWPLARPFFTIWGGLAYLALLVAGVVTAARHWAELTGNLLDRVLAAESLVLLVLVYPVVKLLHELGHGFAVKKWGGEVRETGVMMLVFIPVPYVDATAASAFPGKWQRILVSSAGILVELGLAAIAMLLWTELEDGLLRAACFNVMVIGGVSTLLFNGNPLLRFDGYFVLADLIEIPNLSMRSNRYIGYLIQRYLFGRRKARSPVRAPGERLWFFTYAIAAFCYRLLISLTIVMLVATRYFALGVLLAAWSVSLIFILPALKHLRFVAVNPALNGVRQRAVAVTGGAIAGLIVLLGFVPLPYRTLAEGVIHAPYEATIHAGAAGTVATLPAGSNSIVAAGTPLMEMTDPFAEARLIAAEAEAHKFALRQQQAVSESAYDIRLWSAQAARAAREAQLERERMAAMTVTSPRDGLFVAAGASDLPGRYLERGAVIGHVVDPEALVVRIAVHQNEADLVRSRALSVQLRPAAHPEEMRPGTIVREVPAVGHRIVSAALTTEGGGRFAADPSQGPEPHTLEPAMQFDVRPAEALPGAALGMRVHVLIDHGSAPMAERIWRRVRQVLLRRFNV